MYRSYRFVLQHSKLLTEITLHSILDGSNGLLFEGMNLLTQLAIHALLDDVHHYRRHLFHFVRQQSLRLLFDFQHLGCQILTLFDVVLNSHIHSLFHGLLGFMRSFRNLLPSLVISRLQTALDHFDSLVLKGLAKIFDGLLVVEEGLQDSWHNGLELYYDCTHLCQHQSLQHRLLMPNHKGCNWDQQNEDHQSYRADLHQNIYNLRKVACQPEDKE
mmetsp:Transcript_77857/g.137285  ORF Transcript_77857/g.137285 Transcript_77857/m.137285 type:complete len:216 (+) Transcript_77857:374-1021(+)